MRSSRLATKLLALFSLALMALSPLLAPDALAQEDSTPPAAADAPTAPRSDGRLRIRDLEHADETLDEGIEATRAEALAWEDDARLYSIELGCPLLRPGYNWMATYFSATAQAFRRSGTGAVEAADDDPDTIKTLVTDELSFQVLYRSLLRAGYGDDLVLDVTSGVTVRYNTDADPFGPTTAPKNAVYYHVAIQQRGEIADIWVSAVDGTVYRYEAIGEQG